MAVKTQSRVKGSPGSIQLFLHQASNSEPLKSDSIVCHHECHVFPGCAARQDREPSFFGLAATVLHQGPHLGSDVGCGLERSTLLDACVVAFLTVVGPSFVFIVRFIYPPPSEQLLLSSPVPTLFAAYLSPRNASISHPVLAAVAAMAVDNDTRGWILASLSAIACFAGACVTCVDLIIRLFPGKKDFRIEDSNVFLSSSLSLSAGVMLFSALYSMLPSSQSYLVKGGFSSRQAAWVLLACFLGGVFGIQLLSRVFHMFMPHTVEECDHTHADHDGKSKHVHENGHGSSAAPHPQHHHQSDHGVDDPPMSEVTPLLPYRSAPADVQENPIPNRSQSTTDMVRPSLQSRMTTTVSKIVSMTKPTCDANGPCLGYSDPCGQECFKIVGSRTGTRSGASRISKKSESRRTKSTTPKRSVFDLDEEAAVPSSLPMSRISSECEGPRTVTMSDTSQNHNDTRRTSFDSHSAHTNGGTLIHHSSEGESPESPTHHHHVPQNAFLSISMQTSVAIALHKLPEGFITYATNHANPKLGFTVFIALFIHNISEGFALALPIYLASGSRVKCLILSAILGGLSQPVGAGIAALWLKLAEKGRGDYAPSEKVYGGLFAVTAGIMASVGLSLLQESLEMTHNKRLCMAFAFIGMGVLGASTAMTA